MIKEVRNSHTLAGGACSAGMSIWQDKLYCITFSKYMYLKIIWIFNHSAHPLRSTSVFCCYWMVHNCLSWVSQRNRRRVRINTKGIIMITFITRMDECMRVFMCLPITYPNVRTRYIPMLLRGIATMHVRDSLNVKVKVFSLFSANMQSQNCG